MIPKDWINPIDETDGNPQSDVEPDRLLPSRRDLLQTRIFQQLQLFQTGVERWTPILVTPDGVIIDGHHAVRVAADLGIRIDVTVQQLAIQPIGRTIQELPIRQR